MKESKASSGIKRVSNKEKNDSKEKENTKRYSKTKASTQQSKSNKDNAEMDLSKELHPIGHYINNKEEMVNQLFSAIKSSDLKELLPACLKNYSISELKRLCLHHLQLMSQKRIMNILQGTNVFALSENEDDKIQGVGQTVPSDSNEQLDDSHGTKRSLSYLDDSQQADSTSVDLPEVFKKRKTDLAVCSSPVVSKDSSIDVDTAGEDLDLCPNEEEINSLMKEPFIEKTLEGSKCSDNVADGQVHISSTTNMVEVGEKEWLNAFTKTQLEILELELRARAIRSLMKAQGLQTSDDEDSNIKVYKKKEDKGNL